MIKLKEKLRKGNSFLKKIRRMEEDYFCRKCKKCLACCKCRKSREIVGRVGE